jgi:hypothetical protein
MKKLTLQLDDLAVDSFTTTSTPDARGTVRGFGDSTGCSFGSPNFTACDFTCEFPCAESNECTPTCPGGGTAQTNCGCGTGLNCTTQTAEDFSCEFAC